ncbi:MAG: cardiolipin synthase ClsB [Rhodocyclaceae bacterium]|nr:cardiolipin synthase ClsB [Rhodocyclaceae bacterium]
MAPEFLPGNRLTLLNSGREFFPALIAAIDGALREVRLETYIFEDDASGRPVIDALKRAAGRGVKVCLLVDGFGAAGSIDTVLPELAAAGVHALVYRREIARFRLRRHRLRRLHRKLAMIDARVAFVGGINIVDDLNPPDAAAPRYDYAVRVEGPLIRPIRRVMLRLWEIVVWASLRRRHGGRRQIAPVLSRAGGETAAFVIRDNIRHRHAIEDAYIEAIDRARNDVLIANAYFLPGFRFRRALLAAAARGVRVAVLLQGRVEYRLQHYATQALYGRLLAAGVRIFEYQPSFLHAKVAVIDDEWATVGSSNIDPFSLLLAKEANVVVRDAGFARTLRASLDEAIVGGAVELRTQDWQRLSWPSRLLRWSCYQIVRLAIGLAGYGGKH